MAAAPDFRFLITIDKPGHEGCYPPDTVPDHELAEGNRVLGGHADYMLR